MNSFRFLFKKVGNKWVMRGGGITSGNFAIRQPGTYRTNTRTNNWWGTPSDEIEITSAMVKDALESHDMGVYL
jgi:hypothetical protein